MRVLVYVVDDPWSSDHGGTQRTRAFLRAFRDLGHDVTCMYVPDGAPEVGSEDGVRRLALGARPAGERIPSGIGMLKRRFLPLPTLAGARSEEVIRALRGAGRFDLFLAQQLRTAQYAPHCAGAPTWLDQVDLWSSFAESEAVVRSGLARQSAFAQARMFRNVERRFAAEAACVSAAGFGDAQRLSHASGRDVTWLPNPSSVAAPRTPRARSGRVAGLLGNFAYGPNLDGYDLLVNAWLPRLLALGWSVIVAGHRSEALRPAAGITALGSVDTVHEFYEAVDVSLAPILTGGGIKVKVLEALVLGVPVVATPQALEGFPPAIRAGVLEVHPDGAGLDRLDKHLRALSATGIDLSAFTQDAFTESVARCLSRLARKAAGDE